MTTRSSSRLLGRQRKDYSEQDIEEEVMVKRMRVSKPLVAQLEGANRRMQALINNSFQYSSQLATIRNSGACDGASGNGMSKQEQCDVNNAFQQILRKCIELYFIHGSQSSEKLKPLHYFVNQTIQSLLPNDGRWRIVSYTPTSSHEASVPGYFNPKNVDVTVFYNNKPMGAVSVKFVMSNYSQNSINYFEAMLGECLNLKLVHPHMKFWHFFVCFDQVPYFDNKGNMVKMESASKGDLVNKFEKVFTARQKSYLTPDFISATFVKFRDEVGSLWFKPKKVPAEEKANYLARTEKATGVCYLPDSGRSDKLDWMCNLVRFVREMIADKDK